MIWHSAESEAVLKELGVDKNIGLPNGVADERVEQYGKNILSDAEKPSFLKQLISLLSGKLSIIFSIMAIISCVLTWVYKDQNTAHLYTPLLIIALLLVSMLLDALHRYNSQKILRHLHTVTNPEATVIRDGIEQVISASALVPGDIILLKAGDYITADARLLESLELRCNEAALTEEIVPIEKSASFLCEEIDPIEKRNNMVYAGCSVIQGSAKAVVVATGLNTELGHTAIIGKQTKNDKLPVQRLLDGSYKFINVVISVFCVLYFVLAMLTFAEKAFALKTVRAITDALALAVTAVPTRIPVISPVLIALGIERILQDNILIKKVSATETLGRTTVLCVDKTGILTHNTMALSSIFDGDTMTEIEADTVLNEKDALILKLAAACHTLDGDTTELAIENACAQFNYMSSVEIEELFPRLKSIPFDTDRKIMTTINLLDGKPVAISKGAPEMLIDKCGNCDKEALLKQNDALAENGQRVLCIAMKPLDDIPATPIASDIESDMLFVGLLGLSDPPRSSAIEAIKTCDRAGIKTIMITGDNPVTARAVARRIGILKDGTELITGAELDAMTDEELSANIEKYTVYARVSSGDKVRIIKAWQSRRELVTATGDSADDYEALTTADIGCAVGRYGTDVARGSADIVITNNSFSSIVDAIKESRGLFENIRKSVFYLLSCNFAVILTYLLSVIIFHTYPFPADQLLWLNLLIDCGPFIALGVEKAEEHVMHRRPLALSGHIYDRYSCVAGVLQSIFIAAITLLAYHKGGADTRVAWTMAFCTSGMAQAIHVYNLKTTQSVFAHPKRLFNNRSINTSVLLVIFFILFLISTPIGFVFQFTILPFKQLTLCIGLSLLLIPFCEIVKFVIKRIRKY
ncbi:MAG: cation-translocating P-type ATPase [Clostridia bacterium]|nr:cation-translocating P-type ATPase [Clostridia bacterium]